MRYFIGHFFLEKLAIKSDIFTNSVLRRPEENDGIYNNGNKFISPCNNFVAIVKYTLYIYIAMFNIVLISKRKLLEYFIFRTTHFPKDWRS